MTRRLYLNNWAILIADNEAQWHFGDLKEEKRLQTVDFVRALSKLGSEIWEQGVGIIRLRYPKPHPTNAREIMVINLLDKYGIVISDPLVTTRLITKIELNEPIVDQMRSILAGSASVIYSDFYTWSEADKTLLTSESIDDLFREAISAVTYNEQVTAKNGECSFSALSLEELLFFHALLRKILESRLSTNLSSNPWGIIHSTTGVPVYLEDNSPLDSALISAFSSVIVNYCQHLFGAFPSRLVFGSKSMNGMDFIATEENIFVINNPKRLLKLQRFVRKWAQLSPDIINNLAPALRDYSVELILREERERIKGLEFHRVINKLTNMGIQRARGYELPPK